MSGWLTTEMLGTIMSSVLALVLLFVTAVLAPQRRSQLRLPVIMLMIFGVLEAGLYIWPTNTLLPLLATGCLLFVLSRLLLLITVSLWSRRQPVPQILEDIVQVVLIIAVAMVVFRKAGTDLGALLTTSAVLTAVIGLALQETLGNLVAGLAMHVQHPFEVGDWIQFDSYTGRVVELNWRATTMRTNDEVDIVVPNGQIARAAILNYARPSPQVRRVIRFDAPYEVAPHLVRAAVEEALAGLTVVLPTPAPQVQVEAFGDSGIRIAVYYFIDNFGRRDLIDAQVRERLWYVLARHRIAMPYPIRVVQHQFSDPAAAEAERIAECIAELSAVDVLATLPPDAIRDVARRARRCVYAAGEVIVQQGTGGAEMYIVHRGEVSVAVDDKEVARLGQGEFFGEFSVMTGAIRSATVRAEVATELYGVGKDALDIVLHAHPELVERISHTLAVRQSQRVRTTAQAMPSMEQEEKRILTRIRDFFGL